MSLGVLSAIFGVLFIATLIKSTLGFGESMFAIPLLTMVTGIQVAAPLVSLIVAIITALMIFRNRAAIDVRSIWRLTVAAVIGIPIGVWGLRTLPERPITIGLGVILVLIGLYYLTSPPIRPTRGTPWTYGFGLVSGILGGAYNMAGAPIIIYGAMQQWQAADFRGTLQSYFIIISVLILVNHGLSGLLTLHVLRLGLYALPVMAVGFWVGSHYAEKIPRRAFEKMLYVTFVFLGVALIIQSR